MGRPKTARRGKTVSEGKQAGMLAVDQTGSRFSGLGWVFPVHAPTQPRRMSPACTIAQMG